MDVACDADRQRDYPSATRGGALELEVRDFAAGLKLASAANDSKPTMSGKVPQLNSTPLISQSRRLFSFFSQRLNWSRDEQR